MERAARLLARYKKNKMEQSPAQEPNFLPEGKGRVLRLNQLFFVGGLGKEKSLL